MTTLSFECDYNNGAHPEVMRRLAEMSGGRMGTYGFDECCQQAKQRISEACECPEAQVFFLTGGTQANSVVIDSVLDKCQGVVAADTGHISVHEAGAIEFGEHKVLTLPGHNGKLDATELDRYLAQLTTDESSTHMVYAGMVYITLPTELGTLYTAAELEAIYNVCRRYELPLFVDGARLGYGLTADGCDITLPWLARHCDVFYIGGTKVGAWCGEAVVFTHNNAHPRFFTIQKQHGAVIAKGALIGLQFDALFTDGLYLRIARHANEQAKKMKTLFWQAGYQFYIDSPTNQQFVVVPNDVVRQWEQQVEFTHWGAADDQHTICRFVTSWATTDEELGRLEAIIGRK